MNSVILNISSIIVLNKMQKGVEYDQNTHIETIWPI